MAPPCGTSPRARDKPIPRWLQRLGVPSPPPLRSAEHPSGLPHLQGRDRARVEQANACYSVAARVFVYAHRCGAFVFIENPTNSYVWQVPCIKAVVRPSWRSTSQPFKCVCTGANRDKKTSFLHNCRDLCQLGVMCDHSHDHKAWKVSKSLDGRWQYDTASEAEYPLLLCQRVAIIISKLARQQGYQVRH